MAMMEHCRILDLPKHSDPRGNLSVVEGDVPHGIRAGDAGARIVAVIVPRRTSATAYVVHE